MFIRYQNYMGSGRDLIDWNPADYIGYEPQTTYYSDFSIAEPFGIKAIEDTYKHAMEFWKDNIEIMTELSMVLNWKTWEHAQSNADLCNWYTDKYYEHRDWVFEHFEDNDEAISYYIRTTD